VETRGEGAVLISGVFGSGKSTVAEEIADLLEQRCVPYALMDLDYLACSTPEALKPRRLCCSKISRQLPPTSGRPAFVCSYCRRPRVTEPRSTA
jgi:Mrp family chromosome partitioning ATPase